MIRRRGLASGVGALSGFMTSVLFLLKNTGLHERMGIMLLSAALKALMIENRP